LPIYKGILPYIFWINAIPQKGRRAERLTEGEKMAGNKHLKMITGETKEADMLIKQMQRLSSKELSVIASISSHIIAERLCEK